MYQETMRDIILQEANEQRFSRKHIDAKIRASIEANSFMQAKLKQGIELVQAYMAAEYYPSKMRRIAQMQSMDVPVIVLDIFIGIAYFQQPELFTSVSAQMAARLKFSDRTDAIATTAELMAVLCRTDAFDISKESKMASLMVESRIPLEEDLVTFILNSQCLPPMLCEPLELTHNFSSGYLTHNDSLILGAGNHHDGDLCLDVLNTMSKVALKLDVDFLSKVEEECSEITVEKLQENALKKGKSLSTGGAILRVEQALKAWDTFKAQSYGMYSLLADQGNRFYLNHKVDKRGRIYAHGYHINTQGAPFKKAMLEFADDELVEGVPC